MSKLFKASITKIGTIEQEFYYFDHWVFAMSLVGIIYICKQIFSRTKHAKNKMRRKILDEHLENTLRIATIYTKPNIDKLVSKKTSILIKNFRIFLININIFF